MLRKRLMMSKRMNVGYISYGCYIQDTNGDFWKQGTWDGTATFNGVAIYTEDYAFLVSGTVIKSAIAGVNEWNKIDNKYSTEAEARLDFDGYGNTACLDTYDSGYITLKNNLFPDGERGYIPSLGELLVLYQYKNDIYALLNEVGIDTTDFADNTHWSSTATTDILRFNLWCITFSTGTISKKACSSKYMIWPIKPLWIKGVTPKIENKISIKVDIGDPTELPNGTVIYRSYKYPISEFPVFSDLEVLCKYAQSGNITRTINKGATSSNISGLTSEKVSIISVNPTEDDKYIYVFDEDTHT